MLTESFIYISRFIPVTKHSLFDQHPDLYKTILWRYSFTLSAQLCNLPCFSQPDTGYRTT